MSNSMDKLARMNLDIMCNRCIHKGYCMVAHTKDEWCGNYVYKKDNKMKSRLAKLKEER